MNPQQQQGQASSQSTQDPTQLSQSSGGQVQQSQDGQFEQAFFQLAYDKLQEKLYNLLPFLVGFEIVRKSEDGSKAIGVFAFQSNNSQILLVPAFFVNGSVKGLDMIYSKNNEQFYPLNEDYAEMFMKDDVSGIGSPAEQDRQQIMRDAPPSDFRNLVVPPQTGKYAIASVVEYVKEADDKTKQVFMNWIEKDAEFCESLMRFYDLDKIAEAVTPLGKKYESKSDVKVIYPNDVAGAKTLSPENKKDLLSQGFVIVDNRPESKKSKFGAIESAVKFTNPVDSGFYPYLTETGGIRYGFVLVRPAQLQQNFATDDAIVIDLDSSKKGQAYVVEANQLYVKDQIKVEDYSSVHKMMESPSEGLPSFTDSYILINERFKATQPFRILSNMKDPSGIRRIQVEPETKYDYNDHKGGPTDRPGSIHNLPRGNFYEHPKKEKNITLVMTKRVGDKLEYKGNMVYVPAGFKLLKVNIQEPYDYGCCPATNSPLSKKEKEKNLEREQEILRFKQGKPGNLSALTATLTSKSIFPMTLRSNGSEFFATVNGAKKKYENTIAAKVGMVLDFGLGVKEGSELIDNLIPDVVKKTHIKLAYTGDGGSTPAFLDEPTYTNEFGQPTQFGFSYENVGPQDDHYTGDPTRMGLSTMPEVQGMNVQDSVNQATQLAQAGQKEIFDTHTIATLAKYVSPSDKVNEYMPKMIASLDALGRLLFLVHWETDKFSEMYGRSDMPELVELLTNVFKNLGDLVIFLKRKSPELSINMSKEDNLDV